jgi:hypothetical protein
MRGTPILPDPVEFADIGTRDRLTFPRKHRSGDVIAGGIRAFGTLSDRNLQPVAVTTATRP